MIKFENFVGAAMGVAALFILATPSAAELAKEPMRAQFAAPPLAAAPAKEPMRAQFAAPPSAAAPAKKPMRTRIAAAPAAPTKQATARKQVVADKKLHNLVLQVNTNEPAMMNLALNNATNVAQYYKDHGEKVSIEVITFGPGLHMLRDDTSPVKARIEVLALSTPEISFKACANTQENMRKAEGKDIPIIAQAQVVRSGVVRVMQLQEKGWSYVKP